MREPIFAWLKSRLPGPTEVLQVFGVVVFAVHSWSVGGFLYHVPYFLLKKPWFDIAGIFAYYMAFALAESAALTAGLMLLAIVLPAALLRDGFAVKGTLMTAAAALMSIVLQESPAYETFTFELRSDPSLIAELAAIFALFLILYGLAFRLPAIRKWTMFLADQVSVMLFIYIPLGVLGLVVTALRLV